MTTMQTVRKGMPEGLLDAISQFMEESGIDRIDIRRSPGDVGGDEAQMSLVMGDEENPQSPTLHAGTMLLLPVEAEE